MSQKQTDLATDLARSTPAHFADLWNGNPPTGVFHTVCSIYKVLVPLLWDFQAGSGLKEC